MRSVTSAAHAEPAQPPFGRRSAVPQGMAADSTVTEPRLGQGAFQGDLVRSRNGDPRMGQGRSGISEGVLIWLGLVI